ncbi:MAG: beta-ketoacyl-ACP synthase III [Tannerellaceae bacterium]|jgi:3-oxoacyl-[acyl-carrier-protein] synthase-3|nr:beta-ketoacyl-ACP synthase III [Tannerellaceae bacterium]
MKQKVYITRLSKYLPNDPVENSDMEIFLGLINGKPSVAKSLVLRSNGIKRRYYALDREGCATHTNVSMAARAVAALCRDGFSPPDIELIAAGTASPEQIMPSHGVMVHGEVGGANAETVSFAGSCCTGIQALKYAWLSILSGDKNNAVCVASERLSAWMRQSYFESEAEIIAKLEKKPILAFEKDFLRWMLSDGAAAALLKPEPDPGVLSLAVDWVELCSYAHVRKACMYAGAERNGNGDLTGWASLGEKEWLERSVFALKQDARYLDGSITELGLDFLNGIVKKRGLDVSRIDWFLPHLSSMYFKNKIIEALAKGGYSIPEEKWFVNLPSVGNVASASCFLALEELYGSGRLKKGDTILCMVPESARFSYGYCHLTVC